MRRSIEKQALENIPNTIVQVFDTELKIMATFGGAKLEDVGYNKSKMKGKTIDEAYAETPEIIALYKPFWNMALAGKYNHFEMIHNGIMWSQSFTPILDENSNITAGMVISKDVTEEYKKEKTIKRHQSILEKISFIASHNFRAPVARLDGLLSLILEYETEFNEEVIMLLKTMSLPIAELYEIIKNIDTLTDEDF